MAEFDLPGGSPVTLHRFVTESNRIEGIHRPPTCDEINAHVEFLTTDLRGGAEVGLTAISRFVSTVQPNAVLRDHEGLDVRVGQYVPRRGGSMIRYSLERIFNQLRVHGAGPERAYEVHHEYETLHPFTDGNGRSGRALWLAMMGGPDRVPLGFLHTWYYQSLQAGDGR